MGERKASEKHQREKPYKRPLKQREEKPQLKVKNHGRDTVSKAQAKPIRG